MRAKILFALLLLLLLGDAVMLHGRYRRSMVDQAATAEEHVMNQSWSTPLVG